MGELRYCFQSKMTRILILLTVACFALVQSQRFNYSPPRNPPTQPAEGQRCAGRNFNGRRCCTPEEPCGYGEGDCDGPGDGGANDGDAGCQGDLICGSNNCKKFGLFYHEKDDCCDVPESRLTTTETPIPLDVPLEPPSNQRCRGRNYDGKRCCTPENPCNEGEGDCDGPGDGGLNDGHRGCKGDLVCGSNNCLQFGAYYHPKDDCCERPKTGSSNGGFSSGGVRQQSNSFGQWQDWSRCSVSCGIGKKVRSRYCQGSQCGKEGFHLKEDQEQLCEGFECNNINNFQ